MNAYQRHCAFDPPPFDNQAAYTLPQDAAEPLVYCSDDTMSTASGTMSQPRTPEVQGDCYIDMGIHHFFFDDMNAHYQE
jgi:hypothetical protein